MKKLLLLIFVFAHTLLIAQNIGSNEKPPVFPGCESEPIENLKNCFNNKLNRFIFEHFNVPEKVSGQGYKGDINVLFEVGAEGAIKVIYIDAVNDELKEETRRVFGGLPKVEPSTYNGKPTFVQYSIGIKIPLVDPVDIEKSEQQIASYAKKTRDLNETVSNEYDSITDEMVKYDDKEFSSQLNIPFTHHFYARFDGKMNALGTNSHTAVKPFVYSEVAPYHDFVSEKNALLKGSDGWWSRKLWDEHLVQVQGRDYWFTLDPVFDFQVGKDTEADFSSTYNNTRGIFIQGGVGKKLNFSASIFESQGRFAQYYNAYAYSLKTESDPAIVPGRGVSKTFKDGGFDYPVAEGYLSYSPADFINIQFGHGKNFIGDGYRSLLQSDVASPYPYIKMNTKFWKIKYTNTWTSLRDVRREVTEGGAFKTKYIANHYLSYNVSKRLNIGLFESVMWTNTNDRGFDLNYLNPIIFYRAIEFETGQDAGNAILGASAKYKWNNKVNLYWQFILDEFSLDAVKGGNKSWKNKYGYQLGLKYFDAFNVDNLLLQAEYNRVRPYTYSHNTIVLNYGHNNQPMAHLWGANFSELVLIGRYDYGRWFADAKLIFGTRGMDFNTEDDNFSYGGDIYRNYYERPFDNGVKIGQGNKASTFLMELNGGYLVNPVTNLKLFTNISFRNFDPEAENAKAVKSNTVWFTLGLRTDLFNWYIDN